MFEWIDKIPHLSQNLFCGGLGALFIVLYRVYNVLPDVRALVNPISGTIGTGRPPMSLILPFLLKVTISIGCAAFVSGFLVRPQESYGAIITGMTWTTVIKNLIDTR